jgi:hypothetical protein
LPDWRCFPFDAVELFLQVAAENHPVKLPKSFDLMEYWTAFSAAGLPLRYPQQMRRFNNARVEIKHRGTLPSRQDVEGFRSTVTDFLVDTTPMLFQIEFDGISMSSLVRADDVRSALQAAETAAQADQFGEALEQAAKAFHLSLRHRRDQRLFDPISVVADEVRWQGRGIDDGLREIIGSSRPFEAVARMGESLGEAITVLACHLDYDGYRHLQTYGPTIHGAEGLGGMTTNWFQQEPTTDRSIVDRCVAFAVDAALRLEGRT